MGMSTPLYLRVRAGPFSASLPLCTWAGGSPARVEAAHAIVEAGVAVMGHVGLTPQSISVIGEQRRRQGDGPPC